MWALSVQGAMHSDATWVERLPGRYLGCRSAGKALASRSAWPVHVVSWLLPGWLIVSRMVAGMVIARIVMHRWVLDRPGARCPGVGMRFSGSHLSRSQTVRRV